MTPNYLGVRRILLTPEVIVADSEPGPPTYISGTTCLFTADSGVLNSSDLPAADTEDVKTWTNQGTANDLVQATSTKRPEYKASGGPYSGAPYLQFDGVDETMNIGSIQMDRSQIFLICYKKTQAAKYGVFELTSNAGGGSGGWYMYENTGNTHLYNYPNGSQKIVSGLGTDWAYNGGVWQLIIVSHDETRSASTMIKTYQGVSDPLTDISGTSSGSGTTTDTITDQFNFYSRNQTSLYGKADVFGWQFIDGDGSVATMDRLASIWIPKMTTGSWGADPG